MNISGMLHGAPVLKIVDFPTSEVLGPEASDHEIHSLIEKCGSVFVKPIFKGGVGKKGKSGNPAKRAQQEKEAMQRALGGGPAATPSAPAGSAFGVAPKQRDETPDLNSIELPPGLEKFLGR